MEYEGILFSRLLLSFLWTFGLHIFPLSLYVFLTKLGLTHPIEWLTNSTFQVINIGTWICLIPLHLLVFAVGYFISQELKTRPLFISSRFRLFCSLFTKNNILKLCFYILIGITLPWTYLSLNNNSLTKQCLESERTSCLDENSVFITACGIWTAVYYFLRFDALTEKHLQFPVIRQLRFLQIRSRFPATFWNCFKLSCAPVFYFFIFYFWYSFRITSLFSFILSAGLETSKLERISGLLNFSLLLNTWLMCSVYFSVVETLKLMIHIHYTEHYSFALIKQPNSNSVELSTAIGQQNIPIIQHLACYDLYNMSISQKSVRWQIFTLSQPGGHPHTWNAILHESLSLIDKFIGEIQEISQVPEPVKPKSPLPRHYHMRDIRQAEVIGGQFPVSPPGRIRNLVGNAQKSPIQQQQSAMDDIWAKLESYSVIVQQNSFVSYVFGSKPDAKIWFLISHCQPLIWIVQSISELSANALMEDQFGIVLKDLPLIINTLLRLKFSLDKLGNLQKKFQKRDHDFCMKASLKSAIRRSLYRIAIAYSDYLTDLPLPPENLSCMNSFVKFKEC